MRWLLLFFFLKKEERAHSGVDFRTQKRCATRLHDTRVESRHRLPLSSCHGAPPLLASRARPILAMVIPAIRRNKGLPHARECLLPGGGSCTVKLTTATRKTSTASLQLPMTSAHRMRETLCLFLGPMLLLCSHFSRPA